MKTERPIERLVQFAEWCKKGKLCRSKSDFERMCGLAHNYLYNSTVNTKSSIGTDHLRKIKKTFPMMNLTWVIMGTGAMIDYTPDEGYKEAYEALQKKFDDLKKLLDK